MKKLAAALFALILLLCACQKSEEVDLTKFAIANQTVYTENRRDGLAYHMVAYSEPTDDELFAAIKAVLNDGYRLHTMWFYSVDQIGTLSSPFAKIHQDTDNMLTLKKTDGSMEQRSGNDFSDWAMIVASCLMIFFLLFPIWIPLLWIFLAVRLRRRAKHSAKKPNPDIHQPGSQPDIPLENLQSLFDNGLITQEEFEERKQQL